MTTNADLLSNVPLFRRLSRGSLATFGQACVRLKAEPGQVLFHEGDPGGALYVIVGGRVRIERLSSSGDAQVLGIRGQGEFIGEMSLIDGAPRSATAVAQSRLKLLVLQRSDFERLILEEPSASLAIMQAMSTRIREAASALLDMRSREVWERLHAFLTKEADDDGLVSISGSQTNLAGQLGCTREAVSRALSRLIADGKLVRLATREFKLIERA